MTTYSLSPAALDKLLANDDIRPSMHTISRLGCILYLNATIRILHPSFADFLSNHNRCKRDIWFIDVAAHNLRVAGCRLDHLDSYLRRNVCLLTLSNKMEVSLPEDIVYGSCFWIEHVWMIKNATCISEQLEMFLFKHILHWFEAMSIMKRSKETFGMLTPLQNWYVSCVHTRLVACLHTSQISLPGNTRSQELVNDSFRFAQAFSDAIERHPLHVYSTALLFTPVDTMLYRNFHDIRRDPCLAQGAEKSWSPLLLALHDMEACLVLQFSPDSTQVLSSAKDSISIHDATTGALTIGPIPGRQCCFSQTDPSSYLPGNIY
jgi:hypothetical protein